MYGLPRLSVVNRITQVRLFNHAGNMQVGQAMTGRSACCKTFQRYANWAGGGCPRLVGMWKTMHIITQGRKNISDNSQVNRQVLYGVICKESLWLDREKIQRNGHGVYLNDQRMKDPREVGGVGSTVFLGSHR